MKNLLSLLLLLSITAFMSCKKGEMGDMGPAGQDGQDGIDGQNGQNGQNGNANVKSYETTVEFADWVPHTFYLEYVDLQVPIITEQIAATGMVMVYWYYEAADVWFALPFSETSDQFYYFWFKPGIVRIHSATEFNVPKELIGKFLLEKINSMSKFLMKTIHLLLLLTYQNN